MFDSLTVNLKGPICACDGQALGWGFSCNARKKVALFVRCNNCSSVMVIPDDKLVAALYCDVPYPEEGDGAPAQKPLKIESVGNVIVFPRKKK